MMDILIQLLPINRYEAKIIERLEALQFLGGRHFLPLIIHQPARDIRIEAIRHDVEQILQQAIVSTNTRLKRPSPPSFCTKAW